MANITIIVTRLINLSLQATSFEEWGGAIWHVIREEFRLKCFGFNFPERDVFYTAQVAFIP